MILDKNVNVKIGGRNFIFYKKLYPNIKFMDTINIPVGELSVGSNVKINCLCDNCKKERYITYQKYKESEKLYGEYFCQKCSHIKRKITNNSKYGVDNYLETIKFKEKSRNTIKERYGCENIFQNQNIKNKIKEVILNKYGNDHISKTKHFKIKYKTSCLEQYGETTFLKTNKFKEISKNTKIKRYGNSNYVNVDKMNETKIKNGKMIPSENLTEWLLYKRIVWKLTNRNRKIIFKEWDGYDYYDGEYIKENLNSNKYSNNYPTIDHKISVFEGFKNKISAEIIADIGNLCITKRIININKGINNWL